MAKKQIWVKKPKKIFYQNFAKKAKTFYPKFVFLP